MDVDLLPDELAVSVITIGELRAGVLAASTVDVRDQRLATLTAALRMDPVPVDETVAAEWARLRVLLRDNGQRMPVNDSWIAATAMALGIPVVTQHDDFPESKGSRSPEFDAVVAYRLADSRVTTTQWHNRPARMSAVRSASW